MKVELKPITVHGAPEELEAWKFYQIIYKNKAGEEIWYGTLWLTPLQAEWLRESLDEVSGSK